MAAKIYYSPFIPAFSPNGLPVAGAYLYFFYSGTDDLAPVYTDSSLTTVASNPVQADLSARFPDVYLDGDVVYRVRLTDSDGTQLGADIDPYVPGEALRGPPGAIENSYSDLVQFKASSVLNGKATLFDIDGIPNGDFYWTLGNYTGKADDINVIKADSTALNIGAWVRQTSDGIVFRQDDSTAITRTAQEKARETVSVLDYGAVGDGVTDDSAAIMAAINANKGNTIVLPAGKRFYAAGLIFSGSTYNNTRLVIEGDLKMLANPNPASGNFQTVTYCAIVFHDCDGCSLAVRGSMDGNRLNQPASQQHYLVMIAGATNFTMDDGWTAKEIRGDAVCITHKDLLTASTNSDTIYIGTGVVTNSADDGRNAVSVLSGKNITIQGGISRKVGGIINGERMPGGFDCEPDHDRGHYIENLTVGFWSVETIGTSGFAVIGASMTNDDGNRDWNIVNVQCAGAIVKHTDTTGLIGGPIFRRARNITCSSITLTRASRSAGIEIDYLDDGSFPSVIAQGCSTAITIGFYNFVNGSDINCFVSDYSASAVLAVGVNTSNVRIRARQPAGSGTYGLNRDNAGRPGLAQVGTTFALDCTYSAPLTAAVRNGSVIAGSATILRGGSLLGYPDFSAQMIAADPANIIPSENVIGRNYASTVPTTGTWASDDFVKRVGIAPGTSPGWYNTAPGTAVWKQAAAIAA